MDGIVDVSPTTVQDWLLHAVRTILKCENACLEDHFLDLGGDSLTAPLLANRIESRFGYRPQLEDIFTRSFGELAAFISASASAPDPGTA